MPDFIEYLGDDLDFEQGTRTIAFQLNDDTLDPDPLIMAFVALDGSIEAAWCEHRTIYFVVPWTWGSSAQADVLQMAPPPASPKPRQHPRQIERLELLLDL